MFTKASPKHNLKIPKWNSTQIHQQGTHALMPKFSLSPMKEKNIQMRGWGLYSQCIRKGPGANEGTSWVVDTAIGAAHNRNEPNESCSAGSKVSHGSVHVANQYDRGPSETWKGSWPRRNGLRCVSTRRPNDKRGNSPLPHLHQKPHRGKHLPQTHKQHHHHKRD